MCLEDARWREAIAHPLSASSPMSSHGGSRWLWTPMVLTVPGAAEAALSGCGPVAFAVPAVASGGPGADAHLDNSKECTSQLWGTTLAL